MNHEQGMVREFHRKYGFANGMLHRLEFFNREVWLEWGSKRAELIAEETVELMRAWRKRDITEIADALADLSYVVLGTGVVAGIEIAPLFPEVHRSNMTKDVGEFKPIKGKLFKPPELRPLLVAQGFSIKEL